MSLPLAVRKDIRDNEAKIAEAKKKIDAALGFEVTIEIKNEVIHALLTEANHSKKETFTTPISQYLESLAKQLVTLSTDEMAKAELVRVMSAKKVIFTVQKAAFTDAEKAKMGNYSYSGIRFRDGALEVVIPVGQFWTNIDALSNGKDVSISKILSHSHTVEGQLPLFYRQQMVKADPAYKAAIKKISDAVGFEVQLDWNPHACFKALGAERGQELESDRLPFGEPCARYLDGLGTNLANTCKDSMVKEALLEKFTTKKVGVRIIPTADFDKDKAKLGGDSYVGLSFEGGSMNVIIPARQYWSNIDNISKLKIEKLL